MTVEIESVASLASYRSGGLGELESNVEIPLFL
jgi:hypothetical protein